MPRSASLLLKLFLLLTLVCIVASEPIRQKKDVTHMIVLNDDGRLPKIYRHKALAHGKARSRPKRKPSSKSKRRPSISSEEEASQEKRPISKSKSKKHLKNHKRPKPQRHRHHDNHFPTEDYSYSDSKWQPLTSEEVSFGSSAQHSMVPVSGTMQFGNQAVPIEITTPFSTFGVSAYQAPAFGSIHQPYKPFDYSVLEPQNNPYVSAGVITSDQYGEASAVTPFSIVVENVEEKRQEEAEPTTTKSSRRGKLKRARGNSRFKLNRSESS